MSRSVVRTPEQTKPMEIALRILQGLGRSGQIVWEAHRDTEAYHLAKAEKRNELTPETRARLREDRIRCLKTSIAWLRQKMAEHDVMNWVELPVDIETFVNHKQLLNQLGSVWPRVMTELVELNSGKYVEVVATGAIGVAKTTIAAYTQAYQLYILACMRDPHEVFDLDRHSEILIIIQSITLKLAEDVGYARLDSMVRASPFFNDAFPFDKNLKSALYFPKNIIIKPVAGSAAGAIGQNVIGGIIDELNFMAVVENSKMSKDGSTYDQATANYNSIARRRESRFQTLGNLPGMLCLVSSRNYPGQFTDIKEAEARTNPRIYVYDKRLWELRPERFGFHTGRRSQTLVDLHGPDYPFWFHVFKGDETRKPRILTDIELEEISPEDRHLVDRIPIENKRAFEDDLLPALRDIAGVATLALHPFILNTDKIGEAFSYDDVHSILSRDQADLIVTKLQIFPKRIVNPDEFRFVHCDLALTKDSAGVAMGHVTGFTKVTRGDYEEILPIIQFDFILEVMPPRGGEISFEKIRSLLYTLRDQLHVPIKWVSFDQYQSKDSMQILHQNGFMVGYQSMDTDIDAYDMVKTAIYDGRIRFPKHPKAHKELTTLELNTKKNKIDHPPNGSKDVADSIAGVVFGLTMRREIWTRWQVPLHRAANLLKQGDRGKNSLTGKEKKSDPQSYSALIRSNREAKEREDAA
jgi:hypothetical protein